MPRIGWREWVALPQLNTPAIKAKIDTGAQSSSLHAYHVVSFQRDGRSFVRFVLHPQQRTSHGAVTAEAEVLDYRRVRSSSGHVTIRPVVVTEVEVLGQRWPIELTLANRDEMGFRMLLGRSAVRGRFLVDAGHSFLGGEPLRRRRRRH